MANKSRGGIYAIYLVDGRSYVGSTAQSFEKRWSEHRQRLNSGKHPNLYLVRAWQKYGADAFNFVILESIDFIDEEMRIDRENHWIKKLRPEFNMAPVAGSVLGIKRRQETKILLREINIKYWQDNPRPKGYKRPDTVSKAISEGRKGIKFSKEHVANLSSSLKGRKSNRKGVILSDEIKSKISENRRGIPRKAEASLIAAESNRGKIRSAEQRARISQSRKGKGGKLTEEDVRAIKNSSEKTSVLVRTYDISRSQIKNIKSGKSWSHI